MSSRATHRHIAQHPIVAVGVKYGLVSGGLAIVLFFVIMLFDENPLIVNKWFDYFLLAVFVYFGVREFRQYYNGGFLQFWQGISVGFVTYTTSALLFVAAIGIYLVTYGQAWVDNYVSDRTAMVEENRDNFVKELGESTYQRVRREVQATTTTDILLDDFFRKLMAGLFITLIIAMVQRRSPTKEKT